MTIATRRLQSGSITIGVAVLGAASLLAACGGSDSTTSPTPSPGTTGKAGTTIAPGTTRVPSTEAPTTSESSTSSSSTSSTSSSSTSSSSTTSSSSSTTSTTTVAGTSIQSFTINPTAITCSADGKANATMSWVVTPSTVAISFTVDGAGSGAAQAGYTTSMSNQPLPQNFQCDGSPHRVTLVASSSAGSVSKDVLVTTSKSSSGGGAGGVS